MLNNISPIKIFTVIAFLLLQSIMGQHRGDDFSFQGLNTPNNSGVKATAMGGAVTALTGDISNMFYNPAGISDIKNIQATASVKYNTFSWRENQNYRPNRYILTLPFYLEGIYTPDPSEDGMYDYERLWTSDNLIDSSYVLTPPVLGLDPYSEEAADWKNSKEQFSFNNFAFAVPLNFDGEEFTVSAAYSSMMQIEDFDRNDTYLDPHIGYDSYGDISRVNGVDTLVMNWSKYYRSKSGSMDNISLAVAYKISKILNVGLGVNLAYGSSDDLTYLNRVGTFHLIKQQRFKFWYQDVYSETKGTSSYSSTKFNFGLQIDLEHFKFGVKVDLPYTLQKDWDYTISYKDSISSSSSNKSGTDKMEFPSVFNFGITYVPVENFLFSVDYEYAPFSKTTAYFESPNTTFQGLPDRNSIRFGAEFTPIELISLMAGYRDLPSLFIPDGAAIKTSGPSSKSYTCGISFNTTIGRFDFAYEYRLLRYYDSYYSNTNYNTNEFNNLMFAYTIKL